MGSLTSPMHLGRLLLWVTLAELRRTVEHRKTRLLIAPRDPQALADAIIQVLVDSDLRATMEKNVKAKAEELY